MEAPIATPDSSIKIKTIKLDNEGNNYICKIQIIKEFLEVSLSIENSLKYEGDISLPKIQTQIVAFIDYNINEIFEQIYILNENNFSLTKEYNKLFFKIEFSILNKKKYLSIELLDNETNKLKKDDLINYISELKEKIRIKDENIRIRDEKIKSLEEQLKQFTNYENEEIAKETIDTSGSNNSFNDFNIKLKEPIHILSNHTSVVYCLCLLNDGRLVSCSEDHSIIIYNKLTFKPDLIIKEHDDAVLCIIKLNSGVLASCSKDETIKLFNIQGNQYNVLQTLNYHTQSVNKIIEIKDKELLISCSDDSSILFYFKYESKYTKDYKISTNGTCNSIVQTKANEICYSEKNNSAICFFDLNERKIITTINNISKRTDQYQYLFMITEDLLLIPGENKMSLFNVNQHILARIIDVSGSGWICGVCILNENMILTGDWEEKIKQWKIEGNNLILVSNKEKTHENDINFLLNLDNKLIVSASDDNTIRVWK